MSRTSHRIEVLEPETLHRLVGEKKIKGYLGRFLNIPAMFTEEVGCLRDIREIPWPEIPYLHSCCFHKPNIVGRKGMQFKVMIWSVW